MEPIPCPWCGEPDRTLAVTCARCRGTLLVDVTVDLPVAEPRERFRLARLVQQLGGGDFSTIRERLGKGGVILASVRREVAQGIVTELDASGISAGFRAHVAPAARRAPWGLVAGLVVIPLVALALLVRRPREDPPPPPPPERPAPVEATPAPLTTQEIGQRALAAVAQLSCGNQVGAGFFVEPDVLVTNAHVTCEADDAVQVQLRDGRQLLGTTILRDARLDLARVRVVGAEVPPLPVGTASTLVPGDRVVFIGSPRGMGFTLHEGAVSYVGRALHGVAYLQINGDVNPGNSGGPVLDPEGRAVGIVSLKVENAEGIGLALPLEYAVPPTTPEGRRAWEQVVQEVDSQSERELRKFRIGYGEPLLVGVDAHEGRPVAIVVQRWAGDPRPTSEVYELRREGSRVCGGRASLRTWVSLEESLQDRSSTRMLQWLRRKVAGNELRVAAGELDGGCTLQELYAGGDLVIVREDGDHGAARVALGAADAAQLAEAQRRQAERRRWTERVQQAQDARRERYWRQRFAAARDRIAAVERNVKRAQEEMQRMDALVVRRGAYGLRGDAAVSYQQFKDYVEEADRHRREAQEEMQDLEREASNEAVPLEWRR